MTELINSNVDVIVAWATPTVIAVRHATSIIPIVMVGVGDPIGSGFIASLARPGGNITGLTNISVDLSAKLMELFAELVPGMKRVGVVHNPNNPAVAIAKCRYGSGTTKLRCRCRVRLSPNSVAAARRPNKPAVSVAQFLCQACPTAHLDGFRPFRKPPRVSRVSTNLFAVWRNSLML